MHVAEEKPTLTRGLGLLQATALNMIDMVGVGPFITIPLILAAMHGPQAMLGWIFGAILALADGLVWAELGAAMPTAGGTYVYLREAYGPERWGRLMSFLFIWQVMLSAPLVMASGAIGFAQYLGYLWPGMTRLDERVVAGGVAVFLILLLYRRITTVGKMSVFLWAGVMLTVGWIIFGGLTHFNLANVTSYPPGAFRLSTEFFFGLGAAMLYAMYDYLGYYNVCYLGGEVRNPEYLIPRAILYSIAGIAVLYLLMQVSIISVVPWQEAEKSTFIVSIFMERIYGARAGSVVTGLILWTAFASLFSLMLGYSRIPYAAALDGGFFRIFGRLHPREHFPHVSLLFLGVATTLFSLLFRLDTVIKALLVVRILVQFIGQTIGIILLRRRWPDSRRPFKMWFYPLPLLIAFIGWLYVFSTTGWRFMLFGLGILALGALVFLLRSRVLGRWPFPSREPATAD